MGYMIYGGVQKSLITLLDNLKGKVDVDVLLWGRAKEEMVLPDWVRILRVPTVKSVRAALRENGVLSKDFVLSCLGVLRKKRWTVMPKLKQHYDIAIAYPQNGFPKYYVIDCVEADKKYAFYHHGAYEFTGQLKEWDKEYYPKYDTVYCVSQHTQRLLEETLGTEIHYDVMPNYLNIEDILEKGEEPCEELENARGLKILTVARLSPEKNLLKGLEVAALLQKRGVEFSWFIVGGGEQYAELAQEIEKKGLQQSVFLLGVRSNPYKYMKNCDVYAQFSEFEADSITIKEVAVFHKPLVLSNIVAFQRAQEWINNITLCDTVDEMAAAIIQTKSIQANDFMAVNRVFMQKLKEVFELEKAGQ